MKALTAELIHVGDGFASGRAILIEGDRISDVVESASLGDDVALDDWGRTAIVPGTVNAHGHAFQNLFKGFADDRPFSSWRDDVLYPFSERLDADAIYTGALFAFAEALLAGVTTTVDFFYLHDAADGNAEVVLKAAADLGIRLVFARAFYDPEAPTAAPSRYREPALEAADRCRALARRHHDDPLVSVQPAPHSLHAATPETIAIALDLAHELDVPCHLHLAEAAYEREQVEARYGDTPVRLLAREGLLDPRLITVHTVWVDDAEIDLLAEAGAGVVHCPGANAFLGDGIARVPEMLKRGVRVALGPDGGCANNRQSVFDEMRMASLVAKASLVDGGALDAATAFRLGTSAGADLLGLDCGAIEAGRYADVVGLDLDDLSLQPLSMLDRNIVHSMQQTAIKSVMVGGQTVVERGRLANMPATEIAQRIAEVTAGWSRP
ncbi:MAG: amidohydrolase family protein [Chloroflexi bacterium]|nr:amidohydrolase family protein [Actinomycetota bacterium]MBA3741116.1 amidohydrolase family protein [Chloroflexota bacterium]